MFVCSCVFEHMCVIIIKEKGPMNLKGNWGAIRGAREVKEGKNDVIIF